MLRDIIETIKRVSLEVIAPHTLQVIFGKVVNKNPTKVKVSNTLTLTEEFLVEDSPVKVGEEVILIKYSDGNKYLMLSTVGKVVEKTDKSPANTGGIVNVGYNTSGEWKDLGTFKITHYCCEKYPHICNAGPPYKTATGTTPHIGGCAVDPKKIPLGSYIKINDVVYHAEDTGGAIKGNRIDIVVGTHQEALNKGVYEARVFLKVGD